MTCPGVLVSAEIEKAINDVMDASFNEDRDVTTGDIAPR